jgi:hypothetical protein
VLPPAVPQNEGDDNTPSQSTQYAPMDMKIAGLRRTKRKSPGPASKLNLITTVGMLAMACYTATANKLGDVMPTPPKQERELSLIERINSMGDNTLNYMHPLALLSARGDPDTLTLSEARKADDWPKFVEAMLKEVEDHESGQHWEITAQENIKRDVNGRQHKLVMAVWAFKHKRNPFGQSTNYKVRLNVHGGQTKEGVHYWNTYAPVVQWFSV